MSRVQDLIDELCPDGVPFEPLGRLARIKNGRDYKALAPGGVPVYGSGGIMTFVDHALYDKPSVLIPRKGSLGNLFFTTGPIWTVDTLFYTEIGSEIAEKFLFYYLQNYHLERLNIAGGVPSLTQGRLSTLRIPVPPLEIQAEIVRILDCFTSLEVELEVELEARKEQFEYFRHRALQFSGTVPVFRLCDIASISTGTRPVNMHSHEAGSVPYFNGGVEPSGWVDDANCRSDAITIPSRGSVGIVRYQRDPFWCGPLCYQIRSVRPSLRTKFLFFWLKEIQTSIVALQQTGSIPALNKKQLATVMVPVPALETQDKVIHALNELETLISSPEVGIQAEIESRRQQYEYYRDRLLAFEEKVS